MGPIIRKYKRLIIVMWITDLSICCGCNDVIDAPYSELYGICLRFRSTAQLESYVYGQTPTTSFTGY